MLSRVASKIGLRPVGARTAFAPLAAPARCLGSSSSEPVASAGPQKTHRVLVVGGGRVGRSILHMLTAEKGYAVRMCDADPDKAKANVAELLDPNSGNASARGVHEVKDAEAWQTAVSTKKSLVHAMKGCDAVISAAPFAANPTIAEAAAESGVHYLDLTEDVKVTQFVQSLAEKSKKSAFIPQCGVAPGFITLAGNHVVSKFDQCDRLSLRVGALPMQPNNRLQYNLTWSTEGLVNEYIHPCEALRDGKLVTVQALEGREEVIIDGVTYEAFNTSGGVGSLCHTYLGKIQSLDYKTLRYPGHLNYIRFLLDDLRFKDYPDDLVKIFHRSIPATMDDFVVISVRGLGFIKGRYMEKTFWRKVTGKLIGRHFFTGIEVATAAGVCGVADRLLKKDLPQHGLIKIEDISYSSFMQSPFGKYYLRAQSTV